MKFQSQALIFSSAAVQYRYTRKTQFIENGYYHIYNRGVDKRPIFLRFGHYLRFQNTIRSILHTGSATPRLVYNQSLALKNKVIVLAYCLMPNHYHFLIKQTAQGGISEFMQKLDTSYTKYINLNLHRTGHLFEYAFRAKMIETDPVFLHINRYIHMNPVLAKLVDHPEEWRWSSYQEYINPDNTKPICNSEEILGRFPSLIKYREFVESTDALQTLRYQTTLDKNQDEDAIYL